MDTPYRVERTTGRGLIGENSGTTFELRRTGDGKIGEVYDANLAYKIVELLNLAEGT